MERHRTQIEFDNSFTYKSYAIAFVNNYCVMFYIAFFKGKFYTYPGDEMIWTRLGGLPATYCNPEGCILELAIYLIVALFIKNLIRTGIQYIRPQRTAFFRKKKHPGHRLQWECDYLLNPFDKYHMLGEHLQMIIQYGFVVCFVAAFPPAPFLALFSNLWELRIDALKLTHTFRRPVAVKVPKLAALNGIVEGITYLGIATNAFVIAFTSEFVHRQIYKVSVTSDLKGYVTNSLLSTFNVSEFPLSFQMDRNADMCYYPGMRYPSDHPQKYKLTDDHWYILTYKFLAVTVFEHVLMLVTALIAYSVPDVPFRVKQHINFYKNYLKENRLQHLHGNFIKAHGKKKVNIMKNLSS